LLKVIAHKECPACPFTYTILTGNTCFYADFDIQILGPLFLRPEPFDKVAEISPSGILELNQSAGDLTCESKGGSIGEEGRLSLSFCSAYWICVSLENTFAVQKFSVGPTMKIRSS